MHGRERTDGRSRSAGVTMVCIHFPIGMTPRGRIPGPLNAARRGKSRRREERGEKKEKRKQGRRGGYITYGDLCKIATVPTRGEGCIPRVSDPNRGSPLSTRCLLFQIGGRRVETRTEALAPPPLPTTPSAGSASLALPPCRQSPLNFKLCNDWASAADKGEGDGE